MTGQVISTGVGAPASVPVFLLVGLSPNPVTPSAGVKTLLLMGVG